MRKDDETRLLHMLDAAQEAVAFVQGRTRDDLDNDRQLVLALVKDVEILGEAATQVTEPTRQGLPEIPWERIVGMRNRLVHAYFDVNLDIVWETVQGDLPELISLPGPRKKDAFLFPWHAAKVADPVTVTVADDDAAPTGIALSVQPNTVGEGADATEVTVTATVTGASLADDGRTHSHRPIRCAGSRASMPGTTTASAISRPNSVTTVARAGSSPPRRTTCSICAPHLSGSEP